MSKAEVPICRGIWVYDNGSAGSGKFEHCVETLGSPCVRDRRQVSRRLREFILDLENLLTFFLVCWKADELINPVEDYSMPDQAVLLLQHPMVPAFPLLVKCTAEEA